MHSSPGRVNSPLRSASIVMQYKWRDAVRNLRNGSWFYVMWFSSQIYNALFFWQRKFVWRFCPDVDSGQIIVLSLLLILTKYYNTCSAIRVREIIPYSAQFNSSRSSHQCDKHTSYNTLIDGLVKFGITWLPPICDDAWFIHSELGLSFRLLMDPPWYPPLS